MDKIASAGIRNSQPLFFMAVPLENVDPEELHAQPATPFIGYFIGSPGMNLLDCSLDDGKLRFADFELPIGADIKAKMTSYGNDFTFGIRPEFLEVSAEEKSRAVAFTVAVIEDTGAYKVLTCDRQSSRVKARVAESIPVKEGDRIWVRFPEDRINLFSNERRVT